MEELTYNKYNIILTLLHGSSLNQLPMEVYFTDEEARRAFEVLNRKIEELCKFNSSVALSLICRTEEGTIVRKALTGIVGLEHNIPQFVEVLDDEDYDS